MFNFISSTKLRKEVIRLGSRAGLWSQLKSNNVEKTVTKKPSSHTIQKDSDSIADSPSSQLEVTNSSNQSDSSSNKLFSKLCSGQVCLSLATVLTAIVGIILLPIVWLSAIGRHAINGQQKQDGAPSVGLRSNMGNWWWLAKLGANLLGYLTVLVPIYCAVKVFRRCYGDGQSGDQEGTCTAKDNNKPSATKTKASGWEDSTSSLATTMRLIGCFLGLQAAYLTWGVLQEQVMTTAYFDDGSSAATAARDGAGERFTDSQFLVFTNRLLAGCLAVCLLILCNRRPSAGSCPSVLDFSYCSLSNVLSAWCQYEALLFVSFPTQVLAKACKIVPVMLMGRLVSRRAYRWDEYATAALISAGTSVFLLSTTSESNASHHRHQSAGSDSLSGCALLAGYMLFDSFTSTWQSRLFVRHGLTPLQLMAGTSLLSAAFTVTTQLQQGTLASALAFAARHPRFLGHVTLLSVCSAVGQLLIFYTIERFGPVTFVVIMTIRQAFAILLSCLLFGHPMGGIWGGLGLAGVFLALFLRICLSRQINSRRREKHKLVVGDRRGGFVA